MCEPTDTAPAHASHWCCSEPIQRIDFALQHVLYTPQKEKKRSQLPHPAEKGKYPWLEKSNSKTGSVNGRHLFSGREMFLVSRRKKK